MTTLSKPKFEVKDEDKLVISHQGKEITFLPQLIGPLTYGEMTKQFVNSEFLVPNFAEIVSLLYSASKNQDNKYARRIFESFNQKRDNPFMTSSEILFKPEGGLFISDRNRKDIHVPFGFKTGPQDYNDLKSNSVIQTLAEDQKGMANLIGLAKLFEKNPYILSMEHIRSEHKRNVCIVPSQYGGLKIDCGFMRHANRDGYTFVISPDNIELEEVIIAPKTTFQRKPYPLGLEKILQEIKDGAK